ncbi:MAG TPA: glycosyltransferase family 39 protein [Terriglobales bacterium]|nr:glycosyltransferase family 39 protein [Terriglobales bacterium]
MKKLLALLREHWLFFSLATIAALAMRLFFVFRFPHISGDTFIYGDIAKNWLEHGIYGLSENGAIRPTLIRLPGYPAFLAAMFAIFGREHYTAVMVVQALVDTNTCLVIAALAMELMNSRAALAAYLLAALCPFTANYAAAPLAETLAIFCTAHALYYGVRGLKAVESGGSAIALWSIAGAWSAAGILLRPDGVLVLVPFAAALVYLLVRRLNRAQIVAALCAFVLISLSPLLPWAVRNWRTFHVFQPLAPRYANDPGEFVPHGFNRWVKTWLAEYVSVEEVFWNVPGDKIDISDIPQRAFDSRAQYEETDSLLYDYNSQLTLGPELDARFEQLAQQRISHNLFRYYIWLPVLRIADMWLRPRTELLPAQSLWWNFREDLKDSIFSLFWAAINLFYLLLALRGWLSWRLGLCGAVLVGFVLLRSAFLGTLENPEPRYVLECFPVVLALAGGACKLTETCNVKRG